MASDLNAAVLSLSADTGQALRILRHVTAVERRVFLDRLRPQNIARWAAITHRMASDPNLASEVTPEEASQARNLSRHLVGAVAA